MTKNELAVAVREARERAIRQTEFEREEGETYPSRLTIEQASQYLKAFGEAFTPCPGK